MSDDGVKITVFLNQCALKIAAKRLKIAKVGMLWYDSLNNSLIIIRFMKIDKQFVFYSKQGVHLEIGQKQGYIPKPHAHENEYQIELILSGESQDFFNQKNKKVISGYIDVYNPGESHQTNYRNTNSFIFHIKSEMMKQIYREFNPVCLAPFLIEMKKMIFLTICKFC